MAESTVAIILAGSHVWSADSLEAFCPRALIPVANAPLISYALEWLRDAGVDTVAVCANGASGVLQAYLQTGAQHAVDLFYYEDRIPRGPAGCARDAATAFAAEQFVVVDGSIIPHVDLPALLRAHAAARAVATVVSHTLMGGQASGDGYPRPAGIYLFAQSVLEQVPATGYQDIKESLLPRLHREGQPVFAFPADRRSPRLLGLPSYFAAQTWVLERLRDGPLAFDGYEWRDGVYVHRSAQLSPQARLIGPLMVGPESRVEDEAVVIGPGVIGQHCVIGRRAVVERSVLWDLCVVEERAVLDQCLVTNGVLIETGAVHRGVICAGATCAPVARTPADAGATLRPLLRGRRMA